LRSRYCGRRCGSRRLVLLLAVLSQVADIAWLCLRGQHPGSSTREAVYFLSWLLVLAYPLLARRRPAPLIGALLLPMAMIMELWCGWCRGRPIRDRRAAAATGECSHLLCDDWDGAVWPGGGDQRGLFAERAAPQAAHA
jgi:hypothetical protein